MDSAGVISTPLESRENLSSFTTGRENLGATEVMERARWHDLKSDIEGGIARLAQRSIAEHAEPVIVSAPPVRNASLMADDYGEQ
jgi:hypothetical protein